MCMGVCSSRASNAWLLLHQIYQALSPELKAMWDSEQVRVEIRGFSPGSVVANLIIVFTPSQSQDISHVSAAIQQSLTNSTKYTVDSDGVHLSGTCSMGRRQHQGEDKTQMKGETKDRTNTQN